MKPKGADDFVPTRLSIPGKPETEVDFSTPEAQEAVRSAIALVLEVRNEVTRPLARKVELYERTLGLAVIPVLLRRLVLTVIGRLRQRSRTR
jgi:hypothetical protein